MKMRVGKEGDLEELHKLRSKSIKALCGDIYSKEQLIAWCNRRVDEDAMLRDLERGYVYVFVDKGAIEAYAHVKVPPRVGSKPTFVLEGVYVSKDYAGKGYGTKLLKKIEDVAREKSASQLRVTISKNSEGFFTKNGYEILGPNLRQTIGGQVLEFLPLFKEMVSEEISDED